MKYHIKTAEEALIATRIRQKEILRNSEAVRPYLQGWEKILNQRIQEGRTQHTEKFLEYKLDEHGIATKEKIDPSEKLSLFGVEYHTEPIEGQEDKWVDVDVILNVLRRHGFTVQRDNHNGIVISWHNHTGS